MARFRNRKPCGLFTLDPVTTSCGWLRLLELRNASFSYLAKASELELCQKAMMFSLGLTPLTGCSSLPSAQSMIPSPTRDEKIALAPSLQTKTALWTKRCEQAEVAVSSRPFEQSQ